MTVQLEGGCFASHMLEPSPVVAGTLSQRTVISRSTGAEAISLHILEFQRGLSPGLRSEADTVLYYLDNSQQSESARLTLYIDSTRHTVTPQTGIYVRPGQTLTVLNEFENPAVLLSSQCPDSRSRVVDAVTELIGESAASMVAPFINLADRAAIPTADRWYRVLVDEELGCTQVTQFVGSIPPGRAPDHFHDYEEVLFILRGAGRMWAGETNTPIGFGSCIYLPKGQVHCVENTSEGELRLLGVFYPAGSPAVRYEVSTTSR